MPGEGLHIPVDADDKELRRLAATLRQVKKEADGAAKAVRAAGHAGGGGGGGNGAHGPGGGGHRGGILHGLARLTRGTEFGHFAHMGANVQSVGAAGAGMMAMGVAAVGVTVAFGLLKGASERAMEAAKREYEVRTEMTHAIRDSIKAADSKAVSAFSSNKESLLSIAGVGGQSAVEAAKKFAQDSGPGGIKAYASIAGMHGGFQASNLEGARAAAETGQISIDKAADMISSGKVRAGMNPLDTAAAILSQESGHRITAADVEEMAHNLSGSATGKAAGIYEKGEGRVVAAGLDRFDTHAAGSIGARQGGEAAELKNAEAAAALEVGAKLTETNAQLKVLADSQFRIVKWIEHGIATYGLGSGSAQDAADRETAAQAAATH